VAFGAGEFQVGLFEEEPPVRSPRERVLAHEFLHPRQEGRLILHAGDHKGQHLVGLGAAQAVARNPPHLHELAVVGNDDAFVIDHQNGVRRRPLDPADEGAWKLMVARLIWLGRQAGA